MSKLIPGNHKHLTLDDRIFIEQSLDEGKSFREIYAEVISYNRKNLERELQNESRQHDRQQGKVKRREEEL